MNIPHSLPKKSFRLLPYFLLTLPFIPSCADDGKQAPTIPQNAVPGSFIVQFDDSNQEFETTDANFTAFLDELSTRNGCGEVTREAIAWDESSGVMTAELQKTYHVEFKNCNSDVTKEWTETVLMELSQHPDVLSVEAEAKIKVEAFTENDPLKNRQYHLKNIERDRACEIRSRSQTSSKKPIVVAVVDTGVEATHPDLKDRFFRDGNGRVIGANFVGKGAKGRPDQNWSDQGGHGTHVAGLIGAANQNNIGVVGVGACGPIRIMPVRVIGKNGVGSSLEINRGIQWAAENGADVINLSLGSVHFSRTRLTRHRNSLYDSIHQKGIYVFAAAGNDGLWNGTKQGSQYVYTYPASYDHVISVASTNQSNQLSSFSNRGERIDIAAPGSQVLSTVVGRKFGYMSGTSMATPVAVGTFALSLSLIPERDRTRLLALDMENFIKKAVGSGNLGTKAVSAGKVISAYALAQNMARFATKSSSKPVKSESPKRSYPSKPQTPNPRQTTPVKSSFRMIGLTDGQTISQFSKIKASGIPENATKVVFYWIRNQPLLVRTSFAQISVPSGASSETIVSTDSRYRLLGEGTIEAVALNRNGQVLAKYAVRVNLK